VLSVQQFNCLSEASPQDCRLQCKPCQTSSPRCFAPQSSSLFSICYNVYKHKKQNKIAHCKVQVLSNSPYHPPRIKFYRDTAHGKKLPMCSCCHSTTMYRAKARRAAYCRRVRSTAYGKTLIHPPEPSHPCACAIQTCSWPSSAKQAKHAYIHAAGKQPRCTKSKKKCCASCIQRPRRQVRGQPPVQSITHIES
jgi:hypothetical protein